MHYLLAPFSLISIVALLLLVPKTRETKIGADAPNIIFIMSDDQGWGDVGYRNHPELKTPALDSMAANGLVFDRFYSAAPVCSPTRGSMLTGRHPFRYGIYYANVGHLPDEEVTLPEVLQQYGYATGHFGKWHLGTMNPWMVESNRGGKAKNQTHYSPPWENGYDVCFATESKVPTWNPMINPPHEVAGSNKQQAPGDAFGTYYWTGPGQLATKNLMGTNARVIMDRVVPFIESAVDEQVPFFTTIWFHTPHSPVVAGDEYREQYAHLSEDQQHYYGSITAMDEQISRLRNLLKELEVADNTIIWFCSDNGPAAEGGGPGLESGGRQQGTTAGLRGRKGTLYEGGIRVPSVIEWPTIIRQARNTNYPVVSSDMYPTILDILNITDPSTSIKDGKSIWPVLRDDAESERDAPIGFQSSCRGE
ncbi:sulfatase-like hydrolase/transferase, partial [Tunicatimonas sp.]|uniref:sulfatase-like hydrolase/transferase n=1 Tax=Tunicatimonas sp. TaxID=1940096 RepID=UPI003C76AD92